MIHVDMRSLLNKLNTSSMDTLQDAAGLCVARTNYEVTVEHYLIKTLKDPDSEMSAALRSFEVDSGRFVAGLNSDLEEFKTGNSSRPVFSPLLMELFQEAWLYASVDLGLTRVSSGSVLLALATRPSHFLSYQTAELIAKIPKDTLLSSFAQRIKEASEDRAPAIDQQAPTQPGAEGFIDRFCVNFTQRSQEGAIDPVFGRDAEIRKMIDILARRRKNNPILVGEPGVGKTAVIEGLALRITERDVPKMLLDTTLLGLDLGALEAGASMKGEFEKRLKGVLEEIKASERPIILFIDEAHTLVGAGGTAGGSDAANLLKPALARGEIRTCAATTWSEYKKYFEKDPALARRFQLVKLAEPDVATSTLILRGLKEHYEKSHDVLVRDDAIEAAAELADRYISGRFLPDKAIDLLDTSCARIKINLSAKPAILEDNERTLQALQRKKKALKRDQDNTGGIDQEQFQLLEQEMHEVEKIAEEIRARWNRELELAHTLIATRNKLHQTPKEERVAVQSELEKAKSELAEHQYGDPLVQIEVCPDVVAQVVADWTGVPVGKMLRDEAQSVIDLDRRLKERICGQDQALEVISEGVRAAKAGIKNPDTPLGVFLLVGPSGVGKTETALALSDELFGGGRHVVTINLSEFQEGHSVSRLIGSPPGYVGYGQGGMLTEAVRQQPYSVVLLDEVEKAHLDVMNLFYQVFDKGTLTDGEGKDINFKNTLIILTSNLASDVIQEMTSNASEQEFPLDVLFGAIRPILSNHFKPALLARMSIVPYRSLVGKAMESIVRLKLDRLGATLAESNKLNLSYDDKVIEQISKRCTEVETGARNIDSILNSSVLPQISRTVLGHMASGDMPSQVVLRVGDDGQFAVNFEGAAPEEGLSS